MKQDEKLVNEEISLVKNIFLLVDLRRREDRGKLLIFEFVDIDKVFEVVEEYFLEREINFHYINIRQNIARIKSRYQTKNHFGIARESKLEKRKKGKSIFFFGNH